MLIEIMLVGRLAFDPKMMSGCIGLALRWERREACASDQGQANGKKDNSSCGSRKKGGEGEIRRFAGEAPSERHFTLRWEGSMWRAAHY